MRHIWTVFIFFTVLCALWCEGKPSKKRRAKQNRTKRTERAQSAVRTLIKNTPAFKDFSGIESFRTNPTSSINSELEKRTPTQNSKDKTRIPQETRNMRNQISKAIRIGQISKHLREAVQDASNVDRKKKVLQDIAKRSPLLGIDPQDSTTFDNFDGFSPILWAKHNDQQHTSSKAEQSFLKTHSKKAEEGPEPTQTSGAPDAAEPHVTAEDSLDDMPNTVGPNPNIYGGFAENDVWGNFELPAPDTIDHLKLALKMSHHRPNYAGDQASDANDQLYNYEHHALPEYDVMETPPFHEVLWQNAQLQEALKAGAKPSCAPGMGSCPPVNSEVMCQNIHQACANNAQHPSHKIKFAPPCAAKILALFGCGKPKPPPKKPPKPPPPPPKLEPLPIPIKQPPKDDEKEDKKEDDKKKKGDDKDSRKKGNDISNSDPLVSLLAAADGDSTPADNKIAMISNFHKSVDKTHEKQEVGLMNAEQSLALMTAIGSDLEESLTEKFTNSIDNIKKHKSKNVGKKTKPSQQQETAGEVAHKLLGQEKEGNILLEVEKNLNETGDEDSRFSEWSSWTLCDKQCGEGSKTRRRTCMMKLDQCEGVTEEKSTCTLSKCSEFPTVKSPSESSTEEQPTPPVSSTQSFTTAAGNKIFGNDDTPATDPYATVKNTDEKDEDILLRTAFENLVMNNLPIDKTADTDSDDSPVHVMEKPEELPAGGVQSFTKNKQKTLTDKNTGDHGVYHYAVSTLTPMSGNREWGTWGSCNAECGIGKVTRMMKCDGKLCRGTQAAMQSKACRKKACEDQKSENSLRSNCLSLQNELRHRHGAGALQWSGDLYRKALEISDHLALNSIPAKNLSIFKRPGLNLAFVGHFPNDEDDDSAVCTRAIEEWYSGKENYDYQHPKLSPEVRDFAQLVWKASKAVGVSKTKTLNGDTYIAALYDPAGNNDFRDLKRNSFPRYESSDTERFIDKLLKSRFRKSRI